MEQEPRVLMEVPCENCGGTGRVPHEYPIVGGSADRPCRECSGAGWLQVKVALSQFRRVLGLPAS
jgi:DnaJ-class molecular chaperone